MKLSVVIPVYNEKNTISPILQRVKDADAGMEKEIVIVDDFSTDGTREILKSISDPDIRIFYHEKNQGKGAALQTGFSQIHGDIVLVQDADLEYDPGEYSRLLQPIIQGKADAVYGSRFLSGPRPVLRFWHSLGNKMLTLYFNMISNLNFSDMATCYKVIKREILEKITLKSKRFGFDPEITLKLAKLKCRIYEVPISYVGRKYSEGKKINWKDGIAAFFHIIRFRFFS